MQLKLWLFFIAAAATYTSAVPVDSGNPTKEYQRFVNIPGDDNEMHHIDLEEKPDMELLSQIARNPANNKYYLYTRSNPTVGKELVIYNGNSVWNSGYQASKDTVVLVHGWLESHTSGMNVLLVDAFLQRYDVNVIVMDWRRLATSGYVTAAAGVPALGRGLGQFLEWLQLTTGAQLSRLHLVGFSLGAHLVGNAGRHLRGHVARITGLDPAGPLWQYSSDRLSASDAVYVEAIHTDGGTVIGYGIGKNIGHVDYYPNGGSNQPGCLTNICDHNRAWELYAATVTLNHLVGLECLTSVQFSLNRCTGTPLPLGNGDINKRGSGTYRVDTGRRHPF